MRDNNAYYIDESHDEVNYEVTVVIPPGVPEEIKDWAYTSVLSLTYQDPLASWNLGVTGSYVNAPDYSLEAALEDLDTSNNNLALARADAARLRQEIVSLRLELERLKNPLISVQTRIGKSQSTWL